jgi:hypothetical protein
MPLFARVLRMALFVVYTSWQEHKFNSASILLLLLHLAPSAKALSSEHDDIPSLDLTTQILLAQTAVAHPALAQTTSTPDTTSNPVSYKPSRTSSMSSRLSKEYTSTRKTTYHIAHPPPVVLPKVNRPKLLLQLQELSDNTRPTPAFEVVPSAFLAPKLLRNSSRIVRGKTGYGLEDLIVFRAEDYCKQSSLPRATQSREDEEGPRIVLGAICHNIVNQQNNVAPTITDTEIHLADGSQFSASRPSASYYEFNLLTSDGTSTKARWISRAGRQRFTFTLPLPDSTQHPKLGTLTSSNLTVFSTYKIPPEPGLVVETSPQLYSLIVVSSIWVAFMEGWSALLSPDAGKNNLLSLCRRGSTNSLMSGHTYNSSAGSLTRSITLQNPWVRGKQALFSSPAKKAGMDHYRSVSDSSYFVPPSPATKPIERPDSPPRESYDTAPESNDEDEAEIEDLDGNVDAEVDASDDNDAVIPIITRSGDYTSLDSRSRPHSVYLAAKKYATKTLSQATTEEILYKAEAPNDDKRGSKSLTKRLRRKFADFKAALKRSTNALLLRRRKSRGHAQAIGV